MDFESLQHNLVALLKKNNWTLSTAESCTGGNIAHLITSLSGSSYYFKGSVVAYSTEVKKTILKVESEIIEKETVVSEAVAIAMAKGVKTICNTTIALATTGVAGPHKGEDNKAVGSLCIAWIINDVIKSKSYELIEKNRKKFIKEASVLALEELYLFLIDYITNDKY